MLLLIDIGNTRIKWARFERDALGPQSAAIHSDWTAAVFAREVLGSAPPATRVLVSNVSGARMAEIARTAIQRQWNLEPQFVTSTATAGGVRNAYTEPAKLGVDRWLALIAAHELERGAVCIVSVGTAMTIDGLDADGRHLGGVIVPGPDLMVSSLLQGTSDLAQRAAGGSKADGLFADNTLGAIWQGTQHALSALIERSVQALQQEVGRPVVVLVTGGAAAHIEPALRTSFRSVPDLVLRGLAVLARESPGSARV
ncbi:MAG TPA: type III pantothenate kinase [Steroidobacteraceae bacterium]|jgi:type III pantothenate kinase